MIKITQMTVFFSRLCGSVAGLELKKWLLLMALGEKYVKEEKKKAS